MTASVWNPGASSQVLSNLNRISQEFTALAGQTTFVLLTPPYTPGAQNLEVFKAGEKIPPSEVMEVVGGASFVIAACAGGEKVEAVVFPSTSSVFTTLIDQAAANAAAAAGSAAAAAVSLAGLSQFTGAAIAGALSFVGNGGRIRANLSGALLRDRLLFEPAVPTAAGSVSVVPGGGGGVGSDFTAYGRHPDDVVGCSTISISAAAVGGINRLVSGRTLAVAYNPLAINVGGADVVTYSEAAATLGNMTASVARNSQLTYNVQNLDAGASAMALGRYTSNSGTLTLGQLSTAAGGGGSILDSGEYLTLGTSSAKSLYLVTNNAASATLDSNGQLLLNRATGGLGYGAGAGGTVTQTTSKDTAVTLNRPNGLITMFSTTGVNSQITAGATRTFTLTNSCIAAVASPNNPDLVVVAISAGAVNAAAYTVAMNSIGVGLCTISIRNNTAVTLDEALVLDFKILKGSTT